MKRAKTRRVRGLARAVEIGERVFLRWPAEQDRVEFLALVKKSRAFLRPWEPRRVDPGGRERFDRMLRPRGGSRHEKFLLCRKEDGAILGAFSLNDITRGALHSAYLGCWIGAEHARRGFMTEGVRLALRRAFRVLRLHRVEANFLPKNRASRAMAQRAGFRREGYSLRYLKIAGRWQDHERWALLVDEWRPAEKRRGR